MTKYEQSNLVYNGSYIAWCTAYLPLIPDIILDSTSEQAMEGLYFVYSEIKRKRSYQ